MAEYLLRHRLALRDIRLESAGLGALVGRPMDPIALQLLAENGIDGSEHRARQLTADMLREADLVLATERSQISVVTRVAPEASGKVFLLDKWQHGSDIPDPYCLPRPVFERAYDMIERGVDSWLRYL